MTAPTKLQHIEKLKAVRSMTPYGSPEGAALDYAIAALAPPSGEGVGAFERAMKASWEMVITNPTWAPGSYYAGQNNGIIAALKTVRENYEREIARQQRTTPPPASQERGELAEAHKLLRDILPALACQDTYHPCSDLRKRIHKLLDASPPSSAAEPKAERVIVDYNYNGDPVFADAAGQAKPDDCPARFGLVEQPQKPLQWLEDAAEDRAEQAQAGELQEEIQWAMNGLPQLAVNLRYEEQTSRAETIERIVALLRRLAGGVTVDDAMVSAENFSRQTLYDQRESVYKAAERAGPKLYVALKNLLEAVEERPDDMGIESITLADARAALVAALGEK